ncbi:MAG: ABC transporter ATP-binding protein/permease [Defluviitaleaceae bacterium]|nr:ABC transporter ATP-binding protein/permease [Defluviitaleaceae bacterium]MCL2835585.1 ABC transporter ATP-binding protein/permease [Defluviitaleaceae bacterium]
MDHFEELDYNKAFDAGLWVKIIRFAFRHWKHLALLAGSIVVISMIEAVMPLLARYAIDVFLGDGDLAAADLTNLPAYSVIYVLIIAAFSFFVFLFIYQAGRMQTKMVYDIRTAGFTRLQELSFSYYDTTHVGWIMARMTSDTERIGDFISWSLIDGLGAIAYIAMATVFMANLDAHLTLWVMSVMPVLVVVVYLFQRIVLKGNRLARKMNSKITGSYNEGINGARTTKTLIRENKNFEEFMELTGAMRKQSRKVQVVNTFNFPVVLCLGSIATAFVITVGGVQLQTGGMSLGTLAAFIAYTTMLFEPIYQLVNVFSELQSAQASGERMMSLLSSEPDIVDAKELIDIYGDAMNPKPENWPAITGRVEFKNVTFAYKTGDVVLSDFSLSVKPGERIALVGETGAGKSTIVNLVCRFYEPTEGQVLIDGVDVRERTQIWLQSNLGYVLQTPHLFSGTITENIRYGKLDATMDEVVAAAKAANAYGFIMKLDKGFETDVGEGGGRLSSGEKQLVSFARAIIGNPSIFVLDEATSSIDTETEQIVQNAVNEVLKGRTSFIVAHRLSTIRGCDRILVIADGKIKEQGSHRELLRLKGSYYELYTNQFKEEAEKTALIGG